MKRNSWFLFVMVLAIVACRKEIEYKGSGKEPVMVLNAVVENDSVFRVYLERTVFFLSNEPDSAKHIASGATVTVTNVSTNEVFIMNQATKGNLYEFPFKVTPNTRYKIEVQHPDYSKINSEMTTTTSITGMKVDTISVIKNQSNYLKTNIKWKDPAGENYYMVRVNYVYDSSDDYSDYAYNKGILSNDPSIDNSENTDIDGSVYETSDLLFDDRLFDGQEKSLEILFNYYPPYSFDTTVTITESHTITLISMNKETYLYYVSLKKNLNSDFFSEPVKVYSNITNGFGIFGTLSYSKWKF